MTLCAAQKPQVTTAALRYILTDTLIIVAALTLCAEDTFRWLRIANGVETGRTLTDGIVDDLHAHRVLVIVDASLMVEALFPKFFG